MADVTDEFDNLSPQALRRRGTIKWTYFDPDVLALWVAEMDFPTAPAVRAAIQDVVDREEFGYPQPDATSGLPEVVAAWSAQRYGWGPDPARVHVLPDVLKGVELAIEYYSRPGSPVILPTPAYMPFFDVPGVVGRDIIQVPMATDAGRYVFDLDGIADAFRRGGQTLIVCQPYNPLGRSFTRDELLAVSRVVAGHDGRVIADEIHAPLVYPGGTHVPYASVSPEAAAHAVTMVSASKAWNLPGLKCAQLITSSDRDEEIWRTIPMLKTHGASTFGIRANVAAFRDGGAWLAETLSYLDGNRRLLGELLATHLPEVGYRMPEGTYMAWLDCRALGPDTEPADFFLAKARVAMNPGPAFGPNGQGFVRLNFATSRSILEQAVGRMAEAVRDR